MSTGLVLACHKSGRVPVLCWLNKTNIYIYIYCITLSVDGVLPLDLSHNSFREEWIFLCQTAVFFFVIYSESQKVFLEAVVGATWHGSHTSWYPSLVLILRASVRIQAKLVVYEEGSKQKREKNK